MHLGFGYVIYCKALLIIIADYVITLVLDLLESSSMRLASCNGVLVNHSVTCKYDATTIGYYCIANNNTNLVASYFSTQYSLLIRLLTLLWRLLLLQ